MEEKICRTCGSKFTPHPRRPDQIDCSKPCANKHHYQLKVERMKTDPEYRKQRLDAQKAYRDSNPVHRQRHKTYSVNETFKKHVNFR